MNSATCLIALGTNLGDRLANLRFAVERLVDLDGVDVSEVSKLYETAPVGGPDDQGPYYNAALLAEVTLDADDLLSALHDIEADRDRRRLVRWGPRTLDLDLLAYGDAVSDDPALMVPHPRLTERRFVLEPVCDVAPEFVHPCLDLTMADLLAELSVEPGDLEVVGDDWYRTADARQLSC